MWFLTEFLLEFWLLTMSHWPVFLLTLLMRWERKKRRKNKGIKIFLRTLWITRLLFLAFLLERKDFSGPFSCPWHHYHSFTGWVPAVGSQMQEKRGKNGKLTSIWVAFPAFDSSSIFLVLFTLQILLIVFILFFNFYFVQSFWL